MKIFILTCINENSDLVSCKAYRKLQEAQDAMREQYDSERANWAFGDLDFAQFNPTSAVVGNDSYDYCWQITEDDVR